MTPHGPTIAHNGLKKKDRAGKKKARTGRCGPWDTQNIWKPGLIRL